MIKFDNYLVKVELGPGDGADTSMEHALELAPKGWLDFTVSRCERGWVFSNFNSNEIVIVQDMDHLDDTAIEHRIVLPDAHGDVSPIIRKWVGEEGAEIHVSLYDFADR